MGGDLEEAIKKAYAACKPISFQDMHFRTDSLGPGFETLRPKGCYCWLSNWMLRLVASIRAVLLR